ncbi:MAG: twin-arginine translocation signal domain-containing protein [Syntrophorhabdaceae bacterium]|nr:twin-arginine translocation signal domain-containing protein [Syntrophorhabdaceae bacterium]
MSNHFKGQKDVSRRDFLKSTTGIAAATGAI